MKKQTLNNYIKEHHRVLKTTGKSFHTGEFQKILNSQEWNMYAFKVERNSSWIPVESGQIQGTVYTFTCMHQYFGIA